jgi:hypothetical protein
LGRTSRVGYVRVRVRNVEAQSGCAGRVGTGGLETEGREREVFQYCTGGTADPWRRRPMRASGADRGLVTASPACCCCTL